MHIKGRLHHIQIILEKYGFICQLLPEDSDVSYPRLNISLGRDDHGRERTLVMRLDHFPLPKNLKATSEDLEEQLMIHLFAPFPFSFKEEVAGELARLLMLFNKPLELPGFGLDEINNVIFYRYSIACNGQTIKARPLIAIIGTIMLLMDSLTRQVEAVAEGASLHAVLRSTLEPMRKTHKAQKAA